MRVLVACEFSGVVREAFNARAGVYAMSCDLLPPEDGRVDYHHQGDVLDILGDGWDLMIAHPDCTYLCSSGLHWNGRVPGRAAQTLEALEFVRMLMSAPIPRIAIENPIGRINTAIRAPDQYIQPYEYGHDASKRTGLWLKNLQPLKPTKRIAGRIVMHNGKQVERWANQTDSGQNRLGPSPDRWKERARTYPGWADAMAAQWGAP
ncbi:MAG: hypothetical protein WAW75_00165 [Gallionella sp.]